MEKRLTPIKLFLLTILTLVFFALNSIFCRLALANESIDAMSFTSLRLIFGSLILLGILLYQQKSYTFKLKTNWLSAFFLFTYALGFSLAYVNLDAGLGALILFAVVQITMILFALKMKEHLSYRKLLGVVIAFVGLTYLLLPKESFTLSYFHTFLMVVAGFAWAGYTILGKSSTNALEHTTDNFIKSIPFVIVTFLLINEPSISSKGVILAFASGAITSALGYAIWYWILSQIETITAGIVQLSVPIIAIFLGVLFLGESLSFELTISTAVILSGITLSLVKRN